MNSLMKLVVSEIERPLGAMENFFYLLNQGPPESFRYHRPK